MTVLWLCGEKLFIECASGKEGVHGYNGSKSACNQGKELSRVPAESNG